MSHLEFYKLLLTFAANSDVEQSVIDSVVAEAEHSGFSRNSVSFLLRIPTSSYSAPCAFQTNRVVSGQGTVIELEIPRL